MKKIYMIIAFLSLINFTACSKTPEDPYYFDRAKAASEVAQKELEND